MSFRIAEKCKYLGIDLTYKNVFLKLQTAQNNLKHDKEENHIMFMLWKIHC